MGEEAGVEAGRSPKRQTGWAAELRPSSIEIQVIRNYAPHRSSNVPGESHAILY
jgi:hypothetical protein